MRAPIRLSLVLATAAALVAAFAGPSQTAAPRVPAARQLPDLTPAILRSRGQTWRFQVLMGRPLSHPSAALDPYQRLAFWRRLARVTGRQAAAPPHRRAWLCLHRYEGRWQDDGDPYWGGLQMDLGFMWRYAPRFLLRRGLANRWTPVEQMWVAERALRQGRGFYPWPNSARICGLL